MNPFAEKKDVLMALRRLKDLKSKNQSTDDERQVECPKCKEIHFRKTLLEEKCVCPNCEYHFQIPAKLRIKYTVDEGSFRELNKGLKGGNPLDFPEYREKLDSIREKTGLIEGVLTGTCKIGGNKAMVCVMDSRFLMGSMGVALGEKITRAIEYATKKKLPVIIFSASGGARMQEGILSLFQMAKTSAAIKRHSDSGGLYISVLTNPTTGGVTASFASLGDIIIAEPKALIGFAGPRVIEETIKEKLPEGFQKSEYLLEHGFVDIIENRKNMRQALIKILKLHRR
jgi:acetyl-CoA carboxylase carboxyl transferase subunit beta